ncbi:hypothetical protein DAEQUDRAFT_289227 [Daedalea quercina L-15889]|uniref:Uncharacterized protein n=1 Tax=Daedalea quercina L-15889 TaxID=1314783 RepID=A0A165TXA8_9APHY|nr:hypothetical protein DAEQUDRAFT_289227 [Daedalea quercina L-15889]
MAVQSHRIHSINGPFGPAFIVNSPLPCTQASFDKLPNVSVSSHGKATNYFVPATRAGPPSLHAASFSRVRRPAPPPPSRQARVAFTIQEEDTDPFVDQPIIEIVSPSPRSVPSSSPSIASRTRIPPPKLVELSSSMESASELQVSAPLEQTIVPPGIKPVMLLSEFGYAEARGRLVAYMLLNRNCGRPVRRRRLGCTSGQTYVPSGLSRMVAIDSPV